jgi:hypothetical protein
MQGATVQIYSSGRPETRDLCIPALSVVGGGVGVYRTKWNEMRGQL